MHHSLYIAHDEDAQLLYDTTHRFAQTEIAPLAAKIDQDNIFVRELWPKLGALGLLGITAPIEYGGSGLQYMHHALVMELISTASASVGLSYAAHSNLCVNQICLNGSKAQQTRYLPALISGEHVGALAMSEVGAGSDVMAMQCQAIPCDGGFRLNGNKMWITNGGEADVYVVYARTRPYPETKGITAFIVEKSFAGLTFGNKLDKLGMRGSPTCELIFNDCFVPRENVLGEVDQGTRVLMTGLDYERLILAAGPVGIMQACLDLVLPYVHSRKQFGQPIGEFELMQGKIADMYTQLNAARAYLYTVSRACDTGSILRREAASVILYTSEAATQMALQTIQCLGGNGYMNEYPAGRLLRDAKLYEIGAGTSEIRRMLIGRELFEATR